MTLLHLLQKYGPFTAGEILADIGTMRIASPCADLPADGADLLRQLTALRDAGLLVETDGEWAAVRVVRTEPQGVLFLEKESVKI